MRRTPLSILAISVVITVLAMPSASAANPYPNNADSTRPGNAVHTYCYTEGFVTDPSVADYAMAVLGNTTDMTDLYPIDPAFCSFRQTDAWWWEEDLPAGTRGMRTCELNGGPGICQSNDLKLDFAELDIGSSDWEDRRKTAVHELGHSVGLGHDTISAMISGEIPDTSLTWRTYSQHDIDHINATF
jgi:hypothetical protein